MYKNYEEFILWIKRLTDYQTTGIIGTKGKSPDFYT